MAQQCESFITLDYPVVPEQVCGGVWVAAESRFVPVQLADATYYDKEMGTELYEYKDADGNVRSNMLLVPAGHTSPTWAITDKAADAGYHERQRAVAGAGSLDVWLAPIVDDGEKVRIVRELPEAPEEPVNIFPGDTFRVRASRK